MHWWRSRYLRHGGSSLTFRNHDNEHQSSCNHRGWYHGCRHIASVVSLHNEVVLIDVSAEQLQKATANVEKTLSKWLEKCLITIEASTAAHARLSTSTTLDPVAKVDMVIEAVPEIMDIKKSVFSKLASFVRKDTIVATNTSGLNISEMAVLLENPSRVLGVHFFNPVPVMKLVEVIRANTTDETVFQTAYKWLQKIGKDPVDNRGQTTIVLRGGARFLVSSLSLNRGLSPIFLIGFIF
jgi:3-hydroxyacyl-CoA dehydrogenase